MNQTKRNVYMSLKTILPILIGTLFVSEAFALVTEAPKGFEAVLDVVKQGKIAKTDLTPPSEAQLKAHVVFRTFAPGKMPKDYIDLMQDTADYQKYLNELISKSSELEEFRDKRDSEKVKSEKRLSILPQAKFDLTVRVALKNFKSFGAKIDVFFDVFRVLTANTTPSKLIQEWIFVDKPGSDLYKKHTLPMRETTQLFPGILEGQKGLFIEDDVYIGLRKKLKADLTESLKEGLVGSFETFLGGIRAQLLSQPVN